MAHTVLLSGSEAWVVKNEDAVCIQSTEVNFLRWTVWGCIRMDWVFNDEIQRKLEVYSVEDKWVSNLIEHVQKMDGVRIPEKPG